MITNKCDEAPSRPLPTPNSDGTFSDGVGRYINHYINLKNKLINFIFFRKRRAENSLVKVNYDSNPIVEKLEKEEPEYTPDYDIMEKLLNYDY